MKAKIIYKRNGGKSIHMQECTRGDNYVKTLNVFFINSHLKSSMY